MDNTPRPSGLFRLAIVLAVLHQVSTTSRTDPDFGAIQRDAIASVAVEEARLVEGEDTQLQQETIEPGNPGPDTSGSYKCISLLDSRRRSGP